MGAKEIWIPKDRRHPAEKPGKELGTKSGPGPEPDPTSRQQQRANNTARTVPVLVKTLDSTAQWFRP